MADALKLRILVETDASGVTKGFAAAEAATVGFEKKVTSSFNRLKTSLGSLSTGQKALAGLGVSVGLLGTALGATIRPAIQFESAFAGVKKTVDGTPRQLADIRSGLLDMSTAIPVAASDLADIAAAAGQLGIETPNVLGFTETIAKLSSTTDLVDFEGAAQSLARFINVTSAGQGDAERLADVIVDLGNNSATTESQILTFAQRLAAGLNVVGVAPDKILGIASAFSSMGVEAEAGASSLTTIFTVINDAALTGGERLEVLARTAGMTTTEFSQLAKAAPTQAFLAFAEGLGVTISAGESITPILDQLSLGGLRTSRVLQLAAVNTDLLSASLEIAADQWANGGATQAEFNARLETTQAKLEVLRNNVVAIGIAVGSAFLGTLATGIDKLTAGLQEMARILGPAAAEVGEFLLNLAAGVAQIGSVLLVQSGAIQAFATLLAGIGAAAELVFGAINSLPPTVIALTAALALLGRTQALSGLVQLATQAVLTGNALGVATTTASGFGSSLSSLALGINPVTAAMVALGAVFLIQSQHIKKIEDAAEDANASLREMLQASFTGEQTGAYKAVTAIRTEMESLADTIADFEGRSGFEKWYKSIINAYTHLGGYNEEVEVAKGRMAELNDLLNEANVDTYVTSIESVARNLGLTVDAAEAAAVATGTFDLAVEGGLDNLIALQDAIDGYVNGTLGLGEASAETTTAVLEGTATLAQYAEVLGVSEQSLIALAVAADDVNLDDLNGDPEARDQVLMQLAAMVANAQQLAAAFHGAETATMAQTDAMIAAQVATDSLLASTDSLSAALDRVAAAQAGLSFQAQLTAEAQANLTAAQEAYNEEASPETLQSLAEAYGEMNRAQAATAGSVAEAEAGQRALVASFLDTIDAAELTDEQINTLLTSFVLLADDWLATLVIEGLEQQVEVDGINESLDETARDVVARIELERAGISAEELDATIAHLERINGFNPTAEVTVETSTALAGIAALEAALAVMAGQDRTVEIDADTGPADTVVRGFDTRLRGLVAEDRVVWIDADVFDALAKVEQADAATDAYTDADHTASIDADPSGAVEGAATAQAKAVLFATSSYVAALKADPAQAKASLQAISNLIKIWRLADYTARLRANASQAISATNVASAYATRFAVTPYTAYLRANASQAISAIQSAVYALSRFRSRTIYLKTVRSTTYLNENGGIYDSHGAVAFADGGTMSGAVIERPGEAKIYAPTYPGRFFAEPGTGGEAYIPLAESKRSSALQVLDRVNQMFGRFASGGTVTPTAPIGRSASTVNRSATVQLDVSMPITVNGGPGLDERALAAMVGDRVDRAIGTVARNLENDLIRS